MAVTSPQAALAAALLALSCASARPAIVEDAIGVTFPDRIGKMALEGRKPFDDRRLGAVIRYNESGRGMSEGGLTVGIYVYDGGLSHVSDDLDSRQVRANFREVVSEVKMMEQMHKVLAVRLPSDGERKTSLAGCGPQFLWERYEMDLDRETTLSSATYMTVMKNNFVKLRVSYRKGDAASAAIAEDFVAGLHKVLGGCAS